MPPQGGFSFTMNNENQNLIISAQHEVIMRVNSSSSTFTRMLTDPDKYPWTSRNLNSVLHDCEISASQLESIQSALLYELAENHFIK